MCNVFVTQRKVFLSTTNISKFHKSMKSIKQTTENDESEAMVKHNGPKNRIPNDNKSNNY